MSDSRRTILMLAGLLVLFPLAARAGLFCVDSAASLLAALTTAATNGKNDQIDIVAGKHVLDAGANGDDRFIASAVCELSRKYGL